ncbi:MULTISPECIES: hypothetical protein [Mameliella]|uniref:Uncharacterized protein n=1 Tax=Mameliella alba TaxID=561184 RepID=A0A0B3SAV8_9RHOB|nr:MULTISPECIES: hypothetical protein [Mameliella]ODM47891.1 hypothetical protein A9320_21575 [Ruegeria sp. PBVC088]KHQ53816.1 hypothetical protein OA50_01805 [Mameliella alba]MBY6119492.1 hypothetical protein [Mameliella alba]MDD9728667.1 hypothetical protein [Mameliella sp. AT18]OWV44880.1 hypothetical protein CDZ95_03940 [Mameliella alba]
MKTLTKTLMGAFASLALVLALSLAPAPGYAGDQPNILPVPEDADLDTVPGNSRVFERVLRAVITEMQTMGFRVYDQTGVIMSFTDPNRVRRSDAELIALAQRVPNVPIDVILPIQIYASANQNPYIPDVLDLRIRVTGRMLHAQTMQSLGNFEVAFGPGAGEIPVASLPRVCNRDCVLEHVGNEAKTIGAEVGRVLATKLDVLSPASPQPMPQQPVVVTPPVAQQPVVPAPAGCTGLTTAYTLAFTGFQPQEMTLIEGYLAGFKGYDHHRPVRVTMTSADYWYETCSDVARLNRNLRLMVESMGVQARIAMAGNRFEIQKIGLMGNR